MTTTLYSSRITGPIANQHNLNQPSDSYTRDFGMGLSSHNYASLHLVPGINITNAADLEKGGRYIMPVANQNPINDYAEINDPTTTTEQGTDIIPTHGYDVPKPQNKALQPPSNAIWGQAQSYETPEKVTGPRRPRSKLQVSRHSSLRDDDTGDEYVHPHLLRRAGDAANMPDISSRKVSNESASSSTMPLPRETHSPKPVMRAGDAANMPYISSRKVSNESASSSTMPLPRETHSPKPVMSAHGSYNSLKKLPHQQHQFPRYENIDSDGFIIGQAPPSLNPVDSDVAKPKPVVPIKMELKKPAIPSNFFKPTAELKQIQDANSKERKRRFEPLIPKDTEKKSMYDQPKPARSQTWTLDSKFSVNGKLTRASNYTPIDPTKMDPDNDYEPV